MRSVLFSVFLLLFTVVAAHAQDASAASFAADTFMDELRLGGFLHDLGSPERHAGPDLNAEILFAKPWGTAAQWWLPRPSLGTTLNFGGGTSTLYAGATWQYNVTQRIFLEASLGGSLNNGKHDVPDRSELGCKALFRESASLGYDLTEHWRIMGTIEHNSNAGLCDHNRGLTNYGARIGYKF
jgi:lipid A 3-O-deacylase